MTSSVLCSGTGRPVGLRPWRATYYCPVCHKHLSLDGRTRYPVPGEPDHVTVLVEPHIHREAWRA